MASVTKRPNGSWRARYRDDQGKEHARHFPRKADGQAWLDNVTTSRLTGTYVDPRDSRVTLASFYAEWSQRQVWAAGTARVVNISVRDCSFASIELGKLRRSHVEAWVKEMSAHLQPSTIKTRVANVRTVLNAAVRDRHLASDPTAGVILPRAQRAEHSMRIPTPEQVGQLLEAAEPWFRPVIALCAFAGLRIGEASAVQLGDVGFLTRQLHVQRQVQYEGGAPSFTPPKAGSERKVALADRLLMMLSQHVEQVGVSGAEGWLFVGPPRPGVIRRAWVSTLAAADVPHTKLHDLRHFYASGLIAAGCDPVTVQRALGHASATTTMSIYAHLWPTAEDKTRAAANDLMAASIDVPADPLRTGQA
ncbi:integrase [Frigoribacterium sp. PvP120]|uniref:tyrosine-type recombinase/integrase n=1 Tax=unclassified Frigoribacterium TaxID=2627005 RepID=UPI001B603221|nr:site-specific integrase [Frigoribacterium sp. PvP121]MBP1241718.1 integrase [Frigoribacterium sp. PvP121]